MDGSKLEEPDLVVVVTSPSLGELLSIRTNNRPLGEHLAEAFGTGRPLESGAVPTLVVQRLQHPWPRWSITLDGESVSVGQFDGVVNVIMRTVMDRVRDKGLTVIAASAVDLHGSCVVVSSTDRSLEADVLSALQRNGAAVIGRSEAFVTEAGELVATHLPIIIEPGHQMWTTWSKPPIEGLTMDRQLVEWSLIAAAGDSSPRKVDLIVSAFQSEDNPPVLEPIRHALIAVELLSHRGATSVRTVEALLRPTRCLSLAVNRAAVDDAAQLILSELR